MANIDTQQGGVLKVQGYSGTEWTKDVFDARMGQQEAAALHFSHSKTFRLFVLPAKRWVGEVDTLYGEDARNDPARYITKRALRSEPGMATIIMDAVDKDHKPLDFRVIRADEADVAYVVPATKYWRARVEGE
jgi:hypothetical protein